MDHYRRVCMQGAGGCVACYKSTFAIVKSDRGLFLFHCSLYKILELRDIGLLESLHKVGYCIMDDPLFLQDSDGGLPKVSDLNRSFRPQNLCPDVISIDTATAHIRRSDSPLFEGETHHCIIYIINGFHFSICQHPSDSIHFGNISHKPAGQRSEEHTYDSSHVAIPYSAF